MSDVNDGNVVCNEGAEQGEGSTQQSMDDNTGQNEPTAAEPEQAPEQPTEAPAPKRKPRGHPPPPEGEEEHVRPRLRNKTTCPDCNKQLSVHALRYTHTKVCAAKRTELVIQEVGAEQEAAPKPKAKAQPLIEAQETKPQQILREYAEVAGTQQPPDKRAVVMEYIKEMKHKHAAAKQQRYKTMLSGKI
jgi:hypothetical protein